MRHSLAWLLVRKGLEKGPEILPLTCESLLGEWQKVVLLVLLMEWSMLGRQAGSGPQRTRSHSVLMIRNETIRASLMTGKVVGSCSQRCPLQDRAQDLSHTTQAVFRLSSLSQGLGIKRVKGLLSGQQPGREKADITHGMVPEGAHGCHQSGKKESWRAVDSRGAMLRA